MVIQKFYGAEARALLQPLARLRLDVFTEYPYLYEGNQDLETEYLNAYFNTPDSLIMAVFDGSTLVGATTAISLVAEAPSLQTPFIGTYELKDVMYFGESILKPDYRGKGLGQKFFAEREEHAKKMNAKVATFCTVVRKPGHPKKPAKYKDLTSFWNRLGYAEAPNMIGYYSWKDIGDAEETGKQMQFWVKNL